VPEHDSAEGYWSNPEETSADDLSTTAEDAQLLLEIQTAELPELAISAIDPVSDSQERIHQLEQALDESLTKVQSLQSQLQDQERLETQLAATEEAVSLQKQAMAELKQQLSDQQQALEAQLFQAQIKDQTIAGLLTSVEALAEAQQEQLGRLKTQLSEDGSALKIRHKQLELELTQRQQAHEAQERRLQQLEAQMLDARSMAGRLEAELAAAHQEIKALYAQLSDRAYSIKQLEATLQQTETVVTEQNSTLTTLYRQIEALESQLAQQVKIQARLQQACQELTDDGAQYHLRNTELERQRATLQEQILMQAQQAREYEATIQYWKERCNNSQHQAQQLKEVLQRVLPDARAELSELIVTLQPPTSVEITPPAIVEPTSTPTPSPVPSPRKSLQVDLPGFLRKASTGSRSRNKRS